MYNLALAYLSIQIYNLQDLEIDENEGCSPKKKELLEERRKNERKELTASCLLKVCPCRF